MSILVVQLGARMRYAVPRILHHAGALSHFHTDLAGDRGWPRLLRAIPSQVCPAAVRRLLERRIEGIPKQLVTAHAGLGVAIAWRERRAHGAEALARAHIRSGHDLCRLAMSRGFGNARVVGAIGTSSEPLLAAAKSRGLGTFKEQIIAPPSVERRILAEERKRFSGWEAESSRDGWYRLFEEVAEREWALSDLIVCGSEFVRESVGEAGGPVDRCVVVPYGVSLPEARRLERTRPAGSPLRVLTVGTVGLRKGAPYILAAAKAIGGRAEFCWAGRNDLTETGAAELREAMRLPGQVPRAETARLFAASDVFLLPSLCEGSATVCYEALAYGLPVITTLNTGAVVRDGVDGFIVPIRDPAAIVDRLDWLARDPVRLMRMGEAAAERSADYTLERYGERLTAALRPLISRPAYFSSYDSP
jgi:glycosyltransferase involved in cell wall biosynthesis